MTYSRKTFLKHVGITTLSIPALSFQHKTVSPKLTIGLASYTLRKYTADQLIDICKRLNIPNAIIHKRNHRLPPISKPKTRITLAP